MTTAMHRLSTPPPTRLGLRRLRDFSSGCAFVFLEVGGWVGEEVDTDDVAVDVDGMLFPFS